MKITVTGSLGHIGKPLAKGLVEKGHSVTVVSSKDERRKDIEELGAEAAIGSLEDAGFIASTFDGADAAFTMVPPNYEVPDVRAYYRGLGDNYARAIERSGVKRVVNLSSYGAHLPEGTGFILGAHDVEGILGKLPGIALTHLRPAYFYYNLLNFADSIKTAGKIFSNYGGTDKIVMVDPSDIAAAAAEELEKTSSDEKIRYVASDDRTADDVARVLGAAIEKPDLEWITVTDDQTRAALEEKGLPPHIAANFVDLGAAIHSGALREDYDRHPPIDMGKVKLEDFAKEFATAYRKA